MADFIHHLLFGIYPYLALVVLAVGSVVRYDREPYTWRAGSSQLLRRRQLIVGSVLFHVGVLVIFAGHLVGLLTPIAIWDALGVSHGAQAVARDDRRRDCRSVGDCRRDAAHPPQVL
jgi:nitrate reductase gamma subunit